MLLFHLFTTYIQSKFFKRSAWRHLAVVVTETAVKFYIDGQRYGKPKVLRIIFDHSKFDTYVSCHTKKTPPSAPPRIPNEVALPLGPVDHALGRRERSLVKHGVQQRPEQPRSWPSPAAASSPDMPLREEPPRGETVPGNFHKPPGRSPCASN